MSGLGGLEKHVTWNFHKVNEIFQCILSYTFNLQDNKCCKKCRISSQIEIDYSNYVF